MAQLLGDAGARRASPRRRSCATWTRRYGDKGLAIVGIAVQETTPDDVQAYADRYQLGYDIAFDASADIFNLYKVYALPTQFFIDPTGTVLEVVNGPLTDAGARRPASTPGCPRTCTAPA